MSCRRYTSPRQKILRRSRRAALSSCSQASARTAVGMASAVARSEAPMGAVRADCRM